ncbi:hypothetical protein SAMN02799636_00223 [Methylobacterium sp. 275MFSha3.1]|uniref:hypothetical protein n=1 Tax=Methylobacterium sp. 275MFSha3.1 TaxID=1502746 RepID=UPI0008A730F4|nr:hypothetical protein [Methylobacterium sp. 275MFSha3.1]SEH25749.1 hypothetical protein SAMN02799636_00223 [Methylobacterium sp. 275MFSha3.1]
MTGCLSRDALTAWQSVANEGGWLRLTCVDPSDDVVDPEEVRDGDRARITVQFKPADHAAHVFTVEGWRTFLLGKVAPYQASVVRLAFDDAAFTTEGFRVEPWTDEPAAAEPPPERSDTGPRRQVRCQSADLMAPRAIHPWVLLGDGVEGSTAFACWREVAASMIVRSIPTELYRDGNASRVALAGQPPRRIELGEAPAGDPAFAILQKAARWTYLEGTDIEVRHTFLTAELAREWKPEKTFGEGLAERLEPALDSASLVYKAHLRSGSKDTLKALADLRKTLADEVQKLMQQARDLSAGVWRDVAIVIGLQAVRVTTDLTKTGIDGSKLTLVYVAVAAYVGFSYLMTVRTNWKFLQLVEASRDTWRTKLYAFLDDADYNVLAKQPLDDAIQAYRRTQWWTASVVVIVVFGILAIAAADAGLMMRSTTKPMDLTGTAAWYGDLAPLGWTSPLPR